MNAKKTETYSVSLVTQGRHKFFTLSMPSEVLAKTSTVDTRADNPIIGFQRRLDSRRADEIARYIDEGAGSIPSSIVLSAQPAAELRYERTKRSITFNATPASFLILDGQHRVFGFSRAKTTLRVPVVIYNGLTRAEECQLFIDINTKQRPVPTELLLDIKRLAETESDDEALLKDIFDAFMNEPKSPLYGRMSSASKARGKLSRVTFNAALKGVLPTFASSNAKKIYTILSAYLHAWTYHLQQLSIPDQITNTTLFKAIMLLFVDVAQRVSDRHGSEYATEHFREALAPVFQKAKASTLKAPGPSHAGVYDAFQKLLRLQFTI